MGITDKYAEQKADIHRLVSRKYPFYRELRASADSTSISVPDQKTYLADALAFEAELERLASMSPKQFSALIQEHNFWRLGTVAAFPDCPVLIAEKLYPDDGYAATADQREQCRKDYALVLHLAVSTGCIPMFNPHTKVQFDRSRLLPVHFQDGLIPVNRLSECLRKEDQGYIDLFPKIKPTPYRVSQAPSPIAPIHGAWHPSPAPAAKPLAAPVHAAEPINSSETPVSATPIRNARIWPDGGDLLTRVIWEICYELKDAGEKIQPKLVMRRLKTMAEKQIAPLVSVVDGGVKFEYEKGVESELDIDALRQRIKIWREKTGG